MSNGSTQRPPSEVRSYLVRLVAFIVFGVVLMASVATWAWQTYGKKLADAPPLPPGKPPMHSTTTR